MIICGNLPRRQERNPDRPDPEVGEHDQQSKGAKNAPHRAWRVRLPPGGANCRTSKLFMMP
jgi:hypothetical protein